MPGSICLQVYTVSCICWQSCSACRRQQQSKIPTKLFFRVCIFAALNLCVQLLCDAFVFKIIPMLNPDGVIVGNYRCSLTGRDLNRAYRVATRESFPSISHTKSMIKKFVLRSYTVRTTKWNWNKNSFKTVSFQPEQNVPAVTARDGGSVLFFFVSVSFRCADAFSLCLLLSSQCRFWLRPGHGLPPTSVLAQPSSPFVVTYKLFHPEKPRLTLKFLQQTTPNILLQLLHGGLQLMPPDPYLTIP